MKFIHPILVSMAIMVSLSACESNESTLIISNVGDASVENLRVILSRAEVGSTESEYFKLLLADQEIPVQFDDLDGDGQWDEVVFEVDLVPNADTKLIMKPVESEPSYEPKTQVYLGVSPERNEQFAEQNEAVRPKDHEPQSLPYLYQYEGPGWESDLVAFRTYFDRRNGKDIFGKTKPQLYVNNIGLSDSYHELDESWGMDVLKVGNSLGSGALAMLKNDTIYRLGETGTASYQVVTEGPVRSVFDLKYTGWEVAGTNYDLTERISIWAGKRSFQSEISLAPNNGDTLLTGIVNLKKVGKQETSSGAYQILYTHGEQSENHDVLGMGLLVPNDNFLSFDNADSMNSIDVTDTYTALLQPNPSGKYVFHFVAGWELENSGFKNSDTFEAALKAEAVELSTAVTVSIQ